jgi:hypothetical protein
MFRNFFFYAISGSTGDPSVAGTCDPQCGEFNDKCCVIVQTINQ